MENNSAAQSMVPAGSLLAGEVPAKSGLMTRLALGPLLLLHLVLCTSELLARGQTRLRSRRQGCAPPRR
jgi:hypothetical protein